MALKRYKVFLASSEELAQERKEIALLINRLNNKWTEDKDVYIELVIWEDLLHSFRGGNERIQDYFNEEMLKCDIVIALFYKKVGKFTEEEFKLAYESLKKGNKPCFLFVFFKSGNVAIEDINEELLKIGKLKKEIQGYEQIYGSFDSIDNLILKLQRQLELAILKKLETEAVETEADKEAKAQSDFERYKQHVFGKFRYLDFTGLNAILQKPLELQRIYIKLRAKKSLTGKPEEKVEDFVTLFKQLHKKKSKERQPLRILILGHPGSGKTTLMKWIALQCLKPGEKDFFSQFTPVFISLKDFGRDPDHTFRKKNIADLIIDSFEGENCTVDSFLDNQMKANRLLFLLDGLDEIGDEKIRREAIEWIQKQYIYQNSLVVTSRFSGMNKGEGLTFRDEIPVFEIQDFAMNDIEAFLQNWYRNVEIAVSGERDIQDAIETGEKKYGELVSIIKNQGHTNLRELAVNPLLLTIIAIVHRTRAVLPRDRHKLYEECLKVMIELWNLANRKVNVSFSFDNSMSHLSKIAVGLMEKNLREMNRKEIEKRLPETIENQTRDFFLKEMVLKAGLLYESEGKYGFLHLTFQEYLTARYFAGLKNQNDILRFYYKDYWEETFKLFINTGNAELFFDEVIENLEKKKYWEYIELFEDCLEEIVVEGTRNRIELNVAKKVIQILFGVEYKEENEELIGNLFSHYPLYTHGNELIKEGWNLFNNAPHPFVQSVGASILNRADEKTKAELRIRLKQQIEEFEKQPDENPESQLYFLFQNNNNFILHLARRRKVTDFNFALSKLKSVKIFIKFLIILNIRYLRDILDIRDILDLLDIRDLLDLRDLLDIRYIRDLPDIRFIFDKYVSNYKSIFEKRRDEIEERADKAIEKLHKMSDKKILEFFPNTTPGELKEFRESYISKT